MRGVALARGVDPDELVKGAKVFMEILKRTGKTPGQGSPPFGNIESGRQMEHTLLGDYLSLISLNPGRVPAQKWDTWIGEKRYIKIAEALTSEKSVEALVKMAKLGPTGLTAKYYAAMLLGLDKAAADQP